MLAPMYLAMLDRYYNRTYGQPVYVRVLSVAVVVGLSIYVGVWSWPWALLWGAGFCAGEVTLMVWWRWSQPRLRVADEAGIFRTHRELIALSGALACLAAVPSLVTAMSGGENAAFGIVLAAGCLLILAAQHSLNNMMFFTTAPAATAALIWNLFLLGEGTAAWAFALMGAFFVINAAILHMANSSSFNDLVKMQLLADSANQTKRIFLATMGHEIRTPLNGVLGMAQVMALDDLSVAQRQRLDVIRSSGESLLVLLNDLLDFSKIESGKVEIEAVAFNLRDTIQSAGCGLAIAAEQAGLTFTVSADAVDATYIGDPLRVRQIVQNLVSNAVKFTSKGSVAVAATTTPDGVMITVTDSGIGISNSGLGRLFGEFVQADGSTTRRFGGTGLGLAICRDLATLMGGAIRVESEVGVGSRFIVTLPLSRVAEGVAPPASVALAGPDGAAGLAQLRILVAEDNPSNQLVLRSILGHTSSACTFVDDGAEALAAWSPGAWDLVLMDIQMPVMDGMKATREIRRREAETGAARTPIYALTADAMSHQTAMHRAAGLDGHVLKPIEVDALFALIAEVAAQTKVRQGAVELGAAVA